MHEKESTPANTLLHSSEKCLHKDPPCRLCFVVLTDTRVHPADSVLLFLQTQRFTLQTLFCCSYRHKGSPLQVNAVWEASRKEAALKQRRVNEDILRTELKQNQMRGKSVNTIALDFQHRAEYFRFYPGPALPESALPCPALPCPALPSSL